MSCLLSGAAWAQTHCQLAEAAVALPPRRARAILHEPPQRQRRPRRPLARQIQHGRVELSPRVAEVPGRRDVLGQALADGCTMSLIASPTAHAFVLHGAHTNAQREGAVHRGSREPTRSRSRPGDGLARRPARATRSAASCESVREANAEEAEEAMRVASSSAGALLQSAIKSKHRRGSPSRIAGSNRQRDGRGRTTKRVGAGTTTGDDEPGRPRSPSTPRKDSSRRSKAHAQVLDVEHCIDILEDLDESARSAVCPRTDVTDDRQSLSVGAREVHAHDRALRESFTPNGSARTWQ